MPARRGRVGLRLSSDDAPAVLAVAPGSPAHRAGIAPGARLDAASRHALSRCRAGVSIRISVDGSAHTLVPDAAPEEAHDDLDVRYGWVRSGELTLRVIDLHPRGPARATALYAQGHDLGSIERAAVGDTDPLRGLVTQLARSGFAVRRVERRGVGDSEGDAAWETPWRTERDDLAAAMPEGPTVLIGHSLGAAHAAALAARDPRVRALAVYGGGADRWRAYLDANLRRHLANSGLAPSDIEAITLAQREFYRRVFDDGALPREALDGLDGGLPAVLGVDAAGRIHGRAAHYWRALDAEDLAAPLRALARPTLALWGERDPLTTRDEHARVATLARGTLSTIADADHAFADAAGRYQPRVGEALVAWLDQYV